MRDAEFLESDALTGASAFVEEPEPRKDGNGNNGGNGRPAPSSGTVFVLTGGGLRHMGRPAGNGAAEEGFLGYPPEDLFWKDLQDLLHPDEREGFEALVSDVQASPCTSASVELRLLDGLGRWRPAEVTVLNVLEAPDGLDGGLLVVNVRDLFARVTEEEVA